MADALTITPGGVPSGTKRERFASTKLLHEWAQMQPWDFPPIYELRLGPTPLSAAIPPPTPAEEGMLRLFNRYADLVGIAPTEIQVIEAKMRLDPGALSQVEHYVDLVHYTELLRAFAPRAVQPVILVAFDDPIVHQKAAARGIRVLLYTPTWAYDWLNLRYGAKKRLQIQEG